MHVYTFVYIYICVCVYPLFFVLFALRLSVFMFLLSFCFSMLDMDEHGVYGVLMLVHALLIHFSLSLRSPLGRSILLRLARLPL